MKRVLFIFIIFLFFLCGCGEKRGNKKNEFEVHYGYFENNDLVFDDGLLYINSGNCYASEGNYKLYLSFRIKNTTLKSKNYYINNASVTKEDTNVKYKVSCCDSLSIEPELFDSFQMESIIPSSVSTDKYTLRFSINSVKITIYLYNSNFISYYVDEELVHKEDKSDSNTITPYVYETDDFLYYCDEWYTDSNLEIKFNYTAQVSGNLTLYGTKKPIMEFSKSGDKRVYMYRLNRVPSNGIVIIPAKYEGKTVSIGTNPFSKVIDQGLKEIYIPKGVYEILDAGFNKIPGLKIYYEGTEAEWKEIFSRDKYIYTTNVFYNSTMPY